MHAASSADSAQYGSGSAAMWNGKTLSVVLPTYNEKDSIADVINGFAALDVVDEIIVVNNNAAAGTSEEVAKTVAREVIETRQGYGAAIKRGLREADTDLVAVCEPDGTFNPADLHKLLAFLPECDYVIGSRTVSNFVWDGATWAGSSNGGTGQWPRWSRSFTTRPTSAMSAARFAS